MFKSVRKLLLLSLFLGGITYGATTQVANAIPPCWKGCWNGEWVVCCAFPNGMIACSIGGPPC